ncbi:MAG: toxin-antitoxin system YwqK family antitoxin [Bacteroidales bacterium]|nr:toxin-antitoxin system YwqK family antitoxin [Bacteroidales bacterium]
MCHAEKKLALLFILSLIALSGTAQSGMTFGGETVNVVDRDSLKQGKWYYFYDSLQTIVSCSGTYIDNKRQGVWTEYYRNGNRRSEISYQDNHKYGLMKSFYENGNLAEEGYWDGQHWVGSYKFYFATGRLAYDWNYGDEGNRVGEQSYYYENGQLMRLGTWVDGYADGLVAEYYDSGNLRCESQWKMGRVDGIMQEYYNSGSLRGRWVYNDGVFDEIASRTYRDRVEPPTDVGKDSSQVVPVNPENTIVLEESGNPELFTGTGYYKLLTPDRKVDREGNFVNGTLMSGKRYYYNASGKVIRIAEYEGGRVVNVIDK